MSSGSGVPIEAFEATRRSMENGQTPFNPDDLGGLDPNLLLSVMQGIRPNPITGQVEMEDLQRAMLENMTPDTMKFIDSMLSLHRQSSDIDLTSFDFVSLGNTIEAESFWIIVLNYVGMVDASQNSLDDETARRTPGAMPYFAMECKSCQGPEEPIGQRWAQVSVGLPNSAAVLDFIHHAIATPIPPNTPCLPQTLYLSIKFAPHIPTLRPFLDSLPAPFTWGIETPAQAELHSELAMLGKEHRLDAYIAYAHKEKDEGNAAFAKKDRARALAAYSEAVVYATSAAQQGGNEKRTKEAERLLAVCLSNRAATHLLEGEGMDARNALHDAEAAEEHDPSYVKGYYRQSRAHEVIGDTEKAIIVMERALASPRVVDKRGIQTRITELHASVAE
ncbi:hypothetical protein BV25DRAFT_1821481 [Artomyces pyxidatus]|uniref:Uncharacterized protein n=1 Tax=Artomyces pyxidatus TaxID=48021 RepID=A0ACB8TB60_9AGAM|nr:hypothetical protein BV25DRAFT_1821481 [Artomyces pyxidatus]